MKGRTVHYFAIGRGAYISLPTVFSPQEGDPTGLNPVDDPTSTAMMMDMGEL